MSGTLYLVATPIGNLGDMTLRAIEILKHVDLIACEDTRHTEKLLTHFNVHKRLHRYDEHTHEQSSRVILDRLAEGANVALVSDAGTPGVSDPGARLVNRARLERVKVVPIPGPSSVVAALSATGLGANGFLFLGFLPRRPGRIRRALREGLGLGKTIVIFESPFRIEETLQLVEEVSPDVHVAVARELTKIHEEILQGPVKDVRDQMLSRPKKGEVVLLVEPPVSPLNETDKD